MERLGRYPLSVIVSYLEENDGISFLLTNRRYTYQLLPLFRATTTKKSSSIKNNDNNVNINLSNESNDNNNNDDDDTIRNQEQIKEQEQNQQHTTYYYYKFVVSPIQDPIVLLERLNTKKLYQQLMYYCKVVANKQTTTSASTSTVCNNQQQYQQETQNSNSSSTSIVKEQFRLMIFGLSTLQIAHKQWNSCIQIQSQSKSQSISDDNNTNKNNNNDNNNDNNNKDNDNCSITNTCFINNIIPPASIQLLRFTNKNNNTGNSSNVNTSTNIDNNRTTILTSYPRCGNTLVRTLIERITCTVTGSDTRPDRRLSKQLSIQHNLIGEGLVSTLPIIKTHWPERIGCTTFNCHQAIIIIRNPYDCIDSYFNMNATCTHTLTVIDSIYKQYYDTVFIPFVQNEILIWSKFYHYYYTIMSPTIPTLFIQYENLIQHPKIELLRIMQFLTNTNNTNNNNDNKQQQPLSQFWMNRIDHVLSSSDTLGSYQPRVSSSVSSSSSSKHPIFGKSLHRYTNELLQYISNTAAAFASGTYSSKPNYLTLFNYDVITQQFPTNIVTTKHIAQQRLEDSEEEQKNNDNRTIADTIEHADVPSTVSAATTGIDNTSITSLVPTTVLTVNVGEPYARSVDDPYGRLFYLWRYSVTNNDQNPLPTISK